MAKKPNKIELNREEILEIETIRLKIENTQLKANQVINTLNNEFISLKENLWDKYKLNKKDSWNLKGNALIKLKD